MFKTKIICMYWYSTPYNSSPIYTDYYKIRKKTRRKKNLINYRSIYIRHSYLII